MKLVRYKVMNFRSVKDSGWINCDDVTTLVGVNEAGKSNLLLALWKLNPATDGEIDIIHDIPVADLSTLRNETSTTKFITAEFKISEETRHKIAHEVSCEETDLSTVTISRFYDKEYKISLPKNPVSTKTEEKELTPPEGTEWTEPKYETVSVNYNQDELEKVILKYMPKFVYYSNYGNLSTKLYLPHVIKWLNNEPVQGVQTNKDQVRTLKILFEFVKLQPNEILTLGRDVNNNEHTQDEINKILKQKEERSILLQSAGTELTRKFKEWWKQGEYKFRFEADGDYFIIWVSDSRRPEEVGLELRSTGLQWFLSFYLVFLVESQNKHKNAILLLDEAGLTLHPTAQKDLCMFFNNLATKNQIIHTTHSPFIVDTNNIDRCKVVYVDKDGYTVASDDLRIGDDKLNEQSIYAVHAALGLSVSDILLQGCKPVIVEGPSDQIYLNSIKQALISLKMIAPKEEIVFIPSGGVKGIPGIVSILGAKVGKLPVVIVDSDKSGDDAKNKLTGNNGLYKEESTSIHSMNEFCNIERCEVEDLFSYEMLSRGIDKLFRPIEDDDVDPFKDYYDEEKPMVPQIEEYAKENDFTLPKGWKVELARNSKRSILSVSDESDDRVKMWKKIFDLIDSEKKIN